MTIKFTPAEAWEYASQWGSYMKAGDPGACMYGFNEDCRPQSEEHRQEVIDWMMRCKLDVVGNPDRYDNNEASKIDAFIEFIKNRGLSEDSFIIEISSDTASACRLDGDELDGKVGKDLLDCNRSGDVTEPCLYVLTKWKPQFRIVKRIDGEYKNVLASYEDKLEFYQSVYFESDPAGLSEQDLDVQLVHEAALDFSNN